jgi:hypothetical protein
LSKETDSEKELEELREKLREYDLNQTELKMLNGKIKDWIKELEVKLKKSFSEIDFQLKKKLNLSQKIQKSSVY